VSGSARDILDLNASGMTPWPPAAALEAALTSLETCVWSRAGEAWLYAAGRGGNRAFAWRRRRLAEARLPAAALPLVASARVSWQEDPRRYAFEGEDGAPAFILRDIDDLRTCSDLVAIAADFSRAASWCAEATFPALADWPTLEREGRLHLFACPHAWVAAYAARRAAWQRQAAQAKSVAPGCQRAWDGLPPGLLLLDEAAVDWARLVHAGPRDIRCDSVETGKRVYKALRRAARPRYPRVTAGSYAAEEARATQGVTADVR